MLRFSKVWCLQKTRFFGFFPFFFCFCSAAAVFPLRSPASAVQLFRKRDWTAKTEIFPTLFWFRAHFFLSKRNGKISVLDANFFKVCGRKRGGGESLKIRIWIFRKKSSNFVQKAPQFFKIKVFEVGGLGASRRKVEIVQDFPSVFEIKIQSLLGDSEVRLSEAQSKTKFCKPIFLFPPLAEKQSDIFFDCPKTNFKTIWTT